MAPATLAQLYEQHYPSLVAALHHRLRQTARAAGHDGSWGLDEEAEDLAQQAFLRTLAAPVAELNHPWGWLWRVAWGLTVNRIQAEASRKTSLGVESYDVAAEEELPPIYRPLRVCRRGHGDSGASTYVRRGRPVWYCQLCRRAPHGEGR